MNATNTAPVLLARGVHEAEYLVRGHPVLMAIDSRGNCLRRVAVDDSVDEETARAWLEGIIEHYDPPPPKLELVRFAPEPRVSRGVFLSAIGYHPPR